MTTGLVIALGLVNLAIVGVSLTAVILCIIYIWRGF